MTLSPSQRAVIEREVRSLLEGSRAFAALPSEERARIVANTNTIAGKLVDQELDAPSAHGLHRPTARGAHRPPAARADRGRRTVDHGRRTVDPYALGLAELDPGYGLPAPGAEVPPVPPAPGEASAATTPPPGSWRPDERFQAEGIAAGVTQAGRMVNEVNFPAFVSSLVKGTFDAVVDASIQQMKAYGELVNSVAMSLSEFRDQNIDVGEGRRHLAQKYPSVFDFAGGELSVKEDFDDSAMPDFQADLGVAEPVEDLSDEATVDALVTAARTELARGRQQLLATTILMGINRIIVTDGRINAKITFDFKAEDHVQRQGTVAQWDTSQKKVRDVELGVAGRYVKGHFETPVPLMVSTTTSTSTADIEAKAKLSGEVSLNFRSETFPLERMMTSTQLFQINEAHSGARGTPAPTAGGAPGTAASPAAAATLPPQPPAAPPAAPTAAPTR